MVIRPGAYRAGPAPTEQAALPKTAMASVMKAFHKAEAANGEDGLAEIGFNALILKDHNMQVVLPRGIRTPVFA
jgi:hypothetical protein